MVRVQDTRVIGYWKCDWRVSLLERKEMMYVFLSGILSVSLFSVHAIYIGHIYGHVLYTVSNNRFSLYSFFLSFFIAHLEWDQTIEDLPIK